MGLLLLFGLWPRMWYDPAQAFYDYVNFHLSHVHYLQQYFGHILSAPPFPASFPFVLTLLTVPIGLLALMVLGAGVVFVGPERTRLSLYDRLFILANLAFPIVLIALPSTPVFGGVKHWFVTMAFGSLLAGAGFDWLRRHAIDVLVRAPLPRRLITAALLSLVLVPGAIASVRSVDVGTSWYNAPAGGIRGAADSRMHRQFWGYAGAEALEFLNRNAPRNATVAFHNTTWGAVDWYKRAGLLREDIRWRRDPPERCNARNAAYYLFHHQESFAQDQIEAWQHLGTYAPDYVVTASGVPVLTVYRCVGKGPSPKRTGPETPPSPQKPRPSATDATHRGESRHPARPRRSVVRPAEAPRRPPAAH
ncbi:MAG: hypothetical protein ACI9WU_005005 [Myxococcota bacterium]